MLSRNVRKPSEVEMLLRISARRGLRWTTENNDQPYRGKRYY
jgi:hypothetical protein